MGIPLKRKKKTVRDNLFENGSNRLVGDTSGEGQWVMVSLLPPPTHEGRALSCWPGNRARRTASSSVGPVGRESGSANCCHLGTRKEHCSVKNICHSLCCKRSVPFTPYFTQIVPLLSQVTVWRCVHQQNKDEGSVWSLPHLGSSMVKALSPWVYWEGSSSPSYPCKITGFLCKCISHNTLWVGLHTPIHFSPQVGKVMHNSATVILQKRILQFCFWTIWIFSYLLVTLLARSLQSLHHSTIFCVNGCNFVLKPAADPLFHHHSLIRINLNV